MSIKDHDVLTSNPFIFRKRPKTVFDNVAAYISRHKQATADMGLPKWVLCMNCINE